MALTPLPIQRELVRETVWRDAESQHRGEDTSSQSRVCESSSSSECLRRRFYTGCSLQLLANESLMTPGIYPPKASVSVLVSPHYAFPSNYIMCFFCYSFLFLVLRTVQYLRFIIYRFLRISRYVCFMSVYGRSSLYIYLSICEWIWPSLRAYQWRWTRPRDTSAAVTTI